ncbi:MAG: 1,6-dihydroxycyclohexa-2,4-diene-1-carboxylate dehydrogenase [Pseudomonas sp.]|jgi:dihydroxycyclohexadiene carboxylate dehydrogenase|uniref:1,6-dihydroxycyclohexa-2,4-diene-1-carboxylate dehydrogenase n=1 Tax=Pseudomonas neustonica TaxID=2487346 RepID=A0ABX9XGR1_9PSED|nr:MULTISPECIES: benzoate diol dehydrogenase BenD [Pseudomonas]MBA6421048.1 1,6-dihydroxycyclohexa-2,4-diene-1-carboxylate dehydrogenase [Pseudomonas sp. 5Ae-yellow]MBL4834962.1 1,6-dihydroxycyclohexa-2,4-diene-1-carboxylate dehydrogenase [Pseudomonas sp.]ROZ80939.1 1,6-dihydroxycyclohexa-2,4-diene-1-carboxylate dehydrogenase [Pseudomonas sp. SSM44]ROZ82137.1 1,6-dihydroxycyclohexa-2,4-diene-1-carboxylate dehydrogenase [Pseudomonas neustonica]|tara:strand:- start:5733 stop:6512 length:780 start_codon:yes stop_codon:yes gene_type:complete
MSARFTDKVMVITGAAQGIGKRVAELAAAEGGRLLLVDIAEYVQGVAADLREQGAEAVAVQADLETWAGAEKVMTEAYQQFGRIDILINNVGGTIWAQPFEHYSPEQIAKEIQRSLFPTLWCCRAVLPYMLEQQGGVIVNVSSVATRGLMRVPYGAAKGGVNAMTVNLAYEYAPHNIRVNATAPGGTEAPPRLTPRNLSTQNDQEKAWYQTLVDQTKQNSFMQRYADLDEQAEPILFLASDAASFITGTVIPVAGGDLG